ncbi:cyclic GMP-AMP synthase-like receptor [Musca autumnalis]|uniref:cyclic GMP-AMP synthase-like receptor n=1 Tax=Musca autumnalis TaxID=221902 RepID=UPI003CE9E765
MAASSPFNKHLQLIDAEINVKQEDREKYTKIFDFVMQTIVAEMEKLDSVFKSLHCGQELFGSYSNGVRLLSPSEFDVFVVLKFPFEVDVKPDEYRPGFVHLNVHGNMQKLFNRGDSTFCSTLAKLADHNTKQLRNTNFQGWMFDLIERAAKSCHGFIYHKGFNIKYQKHAVAYNVYIEDLNDRDVRISLDIVPAINVGSQNWMRLRNNSVAKKSHFEHFMAIAKTAANYPPSTFENTFMLVNPAAERDVLWDKPNLKPTLRLLKSLRDKLDLKRFKSFFVTQIFLWEVEAQPLDFWRQPIGAIFVHMLQRLYDCFIEGNLPYFWNEGCNLLDILKPYEIEVYSYKLKQAYRTLKSYPEQPNLSYEQVASFLDSYEDSDSEDDY